MIADPLGLLLVLGAWGAFLWFRDYRTIRTVVLLVAATAVLGVASSLPRLPSLITTGLVTGVLLGVHLKYNRWILAHSPAEQAFDDRLTAINRTLTESYEMRSASADRAAIKDAIQGAIDAIDALQPPGPEWAEVKAMALALLRERLRIHDSHLEANAKARVRFRSERAALHERLRLARMRTMRFWR